MSMIAEIGSRNDIIFDEKAFTIVGIYDDVKVIFLKHNNFVSFVRDDIIDEIVNDLEYFNKQRRISRSDFILSFLDKEFQYCSEIYQKIFINSKILDKTDIFNALLKNSKNIHIVTAIISEYMDRGYNESYFDK